MNISTDNNGPDFSAYADWGQEPLQVDHDGEDQWIEPDEPKSAEHEAAIFIGEKLVDERERLQWLEDWDPSPRFYAAYIDVRTYSALDNMMLPGFSCDVKFPRQFSYYYDSRKEEIRVFRAQTAVDCAPARLLSYHLQQIKQLASPYLPQDYEIQIQHKTHLQLTFPDNEFGEKLLVSGIQVEKPDLDFITTIALESSTISGSSYPEAVKSGVDWLYGGESVVLFLLMHLTQPYEEDKYYDVQNWSGFMEAWVTYNPEVHSCIPQDRVVDIQDDDSTGLASENDELERLAANEEPLLARYEGQTIVRLCRRKCLNFSEDTPEAMRKFPISVKYIIGKQVPGVDFDTLPEDEVVFLNLSRLHNYIRFALQRKRDTLADYKARGLTRISERDRANPERQALLKAALAGRPS